MPDLMDLITERQTANLEAQISAARKPMTGVSAMLCIDCDRPIPEARRATLVGVEHCVDCAELIEKRNKHYRGRA